MTIVREQSQHTSCGNQNAWLISSSPSLECSSLHANDQNKNKKTHDCSREIPESRQTLWCKICDAHMYLFGILPILFKDKVQDEHLVHTIKTLIKTASLFQNNTICHSSVSCFLTAILLVPSSPHDNSLIVTISRISFLGEQNAKTRSRHVIFTCSLALIREIILVAFSV